MDNQFNAFLCGIAKLLKPFPDVNMDFHIYGR
jgi:hypothetical protein